VSAPLHDLKVLVVEDEFLIAVVIEEMLVSAGCIVAGPVSRLTEAIDIAYNTDCDAALLDINLAGERVYPIAEVLSQRGVPFVFLTGYAREVLPALYADRPCLCKPFNSVQLLNALTGAVSPSG
jgi:CheY-like chemotaxis protein